jgi:hypothetical protein
MKPVIIILLEPRRQVFWVTVLNKLLALALQSNAEKSVALTSLVRFRASKLTVCGQSTDDSHMSVKPLQC